MSTPIQITIVGTGCIGTSIGLALHQTELEQPVVIVGHDKEPAHVRAAKRLEAIDKSDWNLIGACEKADIIILAIPMDGMENTLQALAPHLKQGCVVTDTASLKESVIAWADASLPETVSFVGGNPVVRPTGSGPEAAEAGLFKDSIYCITPSPNTNPDAVSLISSLAALLGASPYYLDPAEHDGLIAGVEQLPQALALALVSHITQQASWREMGKLAGGSFEQVSALIDQNPDALSHLLLANQKNLVRWLDTYADALQSVRELIVEGEHESLAQFIDRPVVARRDWLTNRQRGFDQPQLAPDVERPNFFRQFFLGGWRRRE
jgi:prephenate dehydrogenase